MDKISEYIKQPKKFFDAFKNRGFFNWLPDAIYLKLLYRVNFGQKLYLDNPKTFNEKLQWLKLYDHNPLYTTLVDKYAVRDYIKEKIGGEYLIPLVGGPWTNARDIDFDKLPNQFVLKCTHDSGSVVICRDKKNFDIEATVKKLNKALKHNFYYGGREWPYKNVKPQIIAEKYMESKDKMVPEDYKIYCFNGKPKYIVVFHNRFDDSKELSETVYDTNWIPQGISLDNHFKISTEVESKPKCLAEMLVIAEKLSNGMAQSRIDFYITDDLLKFGEITLYTASGFQPMTPESLDAELGKEIDISTLGGYKIDESSYLIWSMCDEGIKDYKIFNFNGEPRMIEVDYNRFINHMRNLYTTQWNYIDAQIQYPANPKHNIQKPVELDEMLALARKLSEGIPHVRTDFYIINGKVYFGELTFYHGNGMEQFTPDQFGLKMGGWISLP